jgi:hypothetical protein
MTDQTKQSQTTVTEFIASTPTTVILGGEQRMLGAKVRHLHARLAQLTRRPYEVRECLFGEIGSGTWFWTLDPDTGDTGRFRLYQKSGATQARIVGTETYVPMGLSAKASVLVAPLVEVNVHDSATVQEAIATEILLDDQLTSDRVVVLTTRTMQRFAVRANFLNLFVGTKAAMSVQ